MTEPSFGPEKEHRRKLARAQSLEADRERIESEAAARVAQMSPATRRALQREVDESARAAEVISRRGLSRPPQTEAPTPSDRPHVVVLTSSEKEAIRNSLGWDWDAEPGIPSADESLAETYDAVAAIVTARQRTHAVFASIIATGMSPVVRDADAV